MNANNYRVERARANMRQAAHLLGLARHDLTLARHAGVLTDASLAALEHVDPWLATARREAHLSTLHEKGA